MRDLFCDHKLFVVLQQCIVPCFCAYYKWYVFTAQCVCCSVACTFWSTVASDGYILKCSVASRSNLHFNFWHLGTLVVRAERQSARMLKIKNVGQNWMAKCNQLTFLPFKGLKKSSVSQCCCWSDMAFDVFVLCSRSYLCVTRHQVCYVYIMPVSAVVNCHWVCSVWLFM